MRALIGHTGFVGSNLLSRGDYGALFNSKNCTTIRGMRFDEVVCAGVSAAKWIANKDPKTDRDNIQRLVSDLSKIATKRFVLISTVDVYQCPVGVSEKDQPEYEGSAYGVNRAELERWISTQFVESLIVRLPALYGTGLKKNVIYDLKNDNMLDSINPFAKFQWYDVRRLEQDLQLIKKCKHKVVNITAEPVMTSLIADKYFPGKLRRSTLDTIAPFYDVRTDHADILGSRGAYHFSSKEVLDGIGSYLGE